MTDDERDKAADVILERAMAELAACVAAATGRDQPICTGYVIVAEWSTLDGQKWITRDTARETTVWQRDGLLHHALHAEWGGER